MNDANVLHLLIETPIGIMTLSYSDRPFRLIEVYLPPEKRKESFSGHPLGIPGKRHPIHQIKKLLKDYFKGRPIDPPWDVMGMDAFTNLQKSVLYETSSIPFGCVRTYRDIAIAIGSSKAYRFVGTTLAQNPYPILIPCHRVIRSDKGLGGFGGGIKLKKYLIDFESHHFTQIACASVIPVVSILL